VNLQNRCSGAAGFVEIGNGRQVNRKVVRFVGNQDTDFDVAEARRLEGCYHCLIGMDFVLLKWCVQMKLE
jgi:hypothetical protein